MLVVSASLATAGIVVCGAAMIDVFFPKGSVLDFVAGLIVLGMIIAFVLIGFVWVCDKGEDYFSGHTDRLLGGEANDSRAAASNEQGRGPDEADRPQDAAHGPPETWPAEDRYAVSLRDTESRAHRGAFPRVQWHGQ
jgi:hypothetical protein